MTGAERSDLARFVDAQAPIYETALAELRAGRKRSHWMWFIFPQLRGLGLSPRAHLFGLADIEEAARYLAHPVLGPRLVGCTRAVLSTEGRTLFEIFGSPDDVKFRSSMTVFERVDRGEPSFAEALERFCGGTRDPRTMEMLAGGR